MEFQGRKHNPSKMLKVLQKCFFFLEVLEEICSIDRIRKSFPHRKYYSILVLKCCRCVAKDRVLSLMHICMRKYAQMRQICFHDICSKYFAHVCMSALVNFFRHNYKWRRSTSSAIARSFHSGSGF